jgi:hypothetical protein
MEKMPAVEEAGRRGKPVSVDLEAEKVEPPPIVELPPVVEAEKVEPSPVVEPSSSVVEEAGS